MLSNPACGLILTLQAIGLDFQAVCTVNYRSTGQFGIHILEIMLIMTIGKYQGKIIKIILSQSSRCPTDDHFPLRSHSWEGLYL